jgi:hypothetical protein
MITLRVGSVRIARSKKIENGIVDFHYDIRIAQLLKSLPQNFFE